MQTGTEKKEIQTGNKKMMNRNRITEGTDEGRHMKAKRGEVSNGIKL